MLMYYVFAIATARLHRPGRPPVPASLLLGLPIANCPRPRSPISASTVLSSPFARLSTFSMFIQFTLAP